MAVQYGEPLEKVIKGLSGAVPKASIIFIVDGCRADVLYDCIDKGKMPCLSRLMNDLGYCRFEQCATVFPSVTIACHASIITGAYPGAHGIVGNNWFIRKKWGKTGVPEPLYRTTREYVKYSWKHPKSDPGLLNGFLTGKYFSIANADLSREVKTVYEAYNASVDHKKNSSMSVLEMVTRGADIREYIDLNDVSVLRGMIFSFLSSFWCRIRGKQSLSYAGKLIDWRSFDSLLAYLNTTGKHRPEMCVVWIPGMDGFSHKNGADNQKEYFRERSRFVELFTGNLDKQFGRLRKILKKRNMLDSTLITVTADHGQYDCREKATISTEQLYNLLKKDETAAAGETFPIDGRNNLDETCCDATVVISQNGGSCHIYVKGDTGWDEIPFRERLQKFLPALESLEYTDLILVRYSGSEYRIWKNGAFTKLSDLDEKLYPLAEERVNSLTETGRAGDIILSAIPPGYYEGKPMKGEHGSLYHEDSMVPLIFIHRGLGAHTETQHTARTIDIAPTVAESMGFLKDLRDPGTDKDKLCYLLDALSDRIESGRYKDGIRGLTESMGGEVDSGRLERDWDVETEDICQNFKAKAEVFLKKGSISQQEFDEFHVRFKKIAPE